MQWEAEARQVSSILAKRSRHLFTIRRIRVRPWILTAASCLALPGIAFAEDAAWLFTDRPDRQLLDLGELGEVSVAHVRLSFVEQHRTRNPLAASRAEPEGPVEPRERCDVERQALYMANGRTGPARRLSDLGRCRRNESSLLDGLIPRVSIQGSFFSVDYSVELDKESRGLFVEYGAFTFGIGDSPIGAAVFNGATFGYPRWMPGAGLLPPRIRDDLKFHAGVMVPIDTVDPTEWDPQVGISVELIDW